MNILIMVVLLGCNQCGSVVITAEFSNAESCYHQQAVLRKSITDARPGAIIASTGCYAKTVSKS